MPYDVFEAAAAELSYPEWPTQAMEQLLELWQRQLDIQNGVVGGREHLIRLLGLRR